MSLKQSPASSGVISGGPSTIETYELGELLGQGGMGSVFRARHRRTGGPVALKLLHPELAHEQQSLHRFEEEARILSSLRHPNLVHVFDLGKDREGRAFLAMELLNGETLAQRLDAHGRLALPDWLALLAQIGSAIQAAHEHGVIHRDIKPQNIFLSRHSSVRGPVEVAKVLDFGIAKVRQEVSQITGDHALLGTPHYMAPEVAAGRSASADGRVDQWALAVVTYRALSGHLPFDRPGLAALLCQILMDEPEPLAARCPGLPDQVYRAVNRALSKSPEARFPTVADFVTAMDPQGFSAGACGSARPSARIVARQGPLFTGLLVVLSLVGMWAWWERRAPPKQALAGGSVVPTKQPSAPAGLSPVTVPSPNSGESYQRSVDEPRVSRAPVRKAALVGEPTRRSRRESTPASSTKLPWHL